MTRKTAPHGGKAGKAKNVTPDDYFPPQGSNSREQLEAIARKPTGLPIEKYILSELFIGKLVRAGLVDVKGGKMVATKKTKAMLKHLNAKA